MDLNTSVELTNYSYEDEVEDSTFDTVTFDLYMGLWLPGILCVLGIIGNALSLLVLARDRSSCATFQSLRALAASDLLLLIGAFFQQVVPLICLRTSSTQEFCRIQGYFRIYCWPVVCIAQMCSIWITMLISSERFIAICYPLHVTRICSSKKNRFIIILFVLISVLFNLPKFFEFQPESQIRLIAGNNITFIVVGSTDLRQDLIYRYLYNTVFYFLVIYAFPMLTITILNIRIVKEIRGAKKNWECLNRNRKKEFQATVLPLVIVLVYFVCGTQSLLAFILDAIYVKFHLWLQIYTAVVNLLVIINSAVNFFLMYAFGKKFRRLLIQMFSCGKVLERKESMYSYTFMNKSGITSTRSSRNTKDANNTFV